MGITTDYVEAVLRRGREPMEPIGFVPDWSDRPYRSKVYADTTRIELPMPQRHPDATLRAALDPPTTPAPYDLESLSAMLQTSYGIVSRRTTLNGNEDSPLLPWFEHATYARGTASGGGLYSVEVYWVAGAEGPLLPGVYHYSYPHHAMDRLLTGDVSAQVRAALPDHAGARETDQFLLLGVKFWKNSFKYNTFCYHVVTMDVGTLLGTWHLWARANERTVDPALWFDEIALDDLLGLDPVGEGVLGVVPLPWAGPGRPATAAPVRIDRRELERSREVIRFPLIEDVHSSCRSAGTEPPAAGALADAVPRGRSTAAARPLPDPDPEMHDVPVEDALRRRRSSFGAFTAAPPLARRDLAGILRYATTMGRCPSELTGGPDQAELTRLVVFVTHVEGERGGVYEVDGGALRPVSQAPVGRFLQWNYFLNNYNLEQAAATVAVLGRPRAVIDAVGDRGYRLLNAEVGAVAQALYTAAAAAGIGCGAVLGFDNIAIAEQLGIDGTDEWPLLLIMLGNERPTAPGLDFRFD